jgi:hypothetical protein
MTNPMKKMLARVMLGMLAVLVGSAGAAFAQTGTGSAASGAADGSSATTASEPSSPTLPLPPPQSATDAHKACTDAMNADPQFAAEIVKVADEKAAAKRDNDTIAAHVDANYHIQKNERHVIYAYAAMWIVAVLFVIFLWRRQQALQVEIANLRHDLEAAAGESATKART